MQEELEEHEREAEALKDRVCREFGALKDPLHKLEFIDRIHKLALSHYFEEEIGGYLEELAARAADCTALYSAAFHFRVLRQHGYHASQGQNSINI